MKFSRLVLHHFRRAFAGLCACASVAGAHAFEADVHFGLTRWLALRAGFDNSQAEAIAVADQRVDGGLIETQWLNLEYACAGSLADVARQAQAANFPSAVPVPAARSERAVLPGGEAARAALKTLTAGLKGKEGLLLGKLGEALHPLQDSWSHQGVPSVPDFGPLLGCDARLASAPPLLRGGPTSHRAELTAAWPADTLEMARATYEVLLAYPAVQGQGRRAEPWASLEPAVEAFAKAGTKTQKRAWFVAQGMAETGFLQGISLPDGPDPGPLNWGGRKLLPLPGLNSTQQDAPQEVRNFIDGLLARWLGGEPAEKIAAEFGPYQAVASGKAQAAHAAVGDLRDLVARLKLWRLQDHGTAAALVHAPAPLTPAQWRSIDRLTRDPRSFIAASSVREALFAVLPAGRDAAPLVPYVVRPLPEARGKARMIAMLRFRHAPYDTVGCIIERDGERWTLVDVIAAVDQ